MEAVRQFRERLRLAGSGAGVALRWVWAAPCLAALDTPPLRGRHGQSG